MATPVYNSSASVATTSTATPTISSFSAAAGSNRLLEVLAGISTGATPAQPTGVTWGGQALTQRGSNFPFSPGSVSKWYLKEADFPSGATGNIVVTYAASHDECGVVAMVHDTVDQATPYRNASPVAEDDSSSVTPSVTVSSNTDDVVTGFLWVFASSGSITNVTTSAGTQRVSTGAIAGGYDWGVASTVAGSSPTITYSVTSGSHAATVMFADSLIGGTGAGVDQEGFAFGDDDGSESAHTLGTQDANYSGALGVKTLRTLVNATSGDPATAAYTLLSQKNGTGGYVAVPTVASVAEAYGTVTYGAAGTAANGGATVAPTYPAGITAGQYLTCVVTSGATNSETPTTPTDWTLLATGASTDGTYGIDTGPRRVTVFGKEATGSESGTLTVSITNGGTCRGQIYRWTKAGSGAWAVTAQGGDDSTSGTNFSATLASMNWNTGDATLVAVGQRVDTGTQSAQSLTASGVTFGARTNRETTAVTTGNDHRHVVDTFAAVTGTSNVNAAPTWAYTCSAACSGGVVVVRLREYTAAVTNQVYVSTSSNVTAGGEATTARLTAPSGGNSFLTGRRWDDENGTDTIDLGTTNYTEIEWVLTTQSPAANTDYFDFRVYAGASALATYGVTPRWTISTGGGSFKAAWAVNSTSVLGAGHA